MVDSIATGVKADSAPTAMRALDGVELAGVEGGVTEGGCFPTLWDLLQQILHIPAPR